MENDWPKLDPITGRMICEQCFKGIHYRKMHSRKNYEGKMENYYVVMDKLGPGIEHGCDGECDCVHLSEETWAAIEQAKVKSNRRDLRKNLQEQLETSPLAATNDSFKKSKKGKTHA